MLEMSKPLIMLKVFSKNVVRKIRFLDFERSEQAIGYSKKFIFIFYRVKLFD